MTFVLIPGAGGSSWVWHLVVDELRARGHEVVSVDLPAEDEAAGIPEYGSVVLRSIAGRDGLILVGLSLGAFTAVHVAGQTSTELVVLVNAMIPTPGETPAEWWEATGQEEARRRADMAAGRDDGGEFDPLTVFFHDAPASVLAEAEDHQTVQSSGPFSSGWSLDRWPDVPVRVLSGRDDRMFPAEFQRRLSIERLGVEPEVIPGGHLMTLSQPDLVSGQLERMGRHQLDSDGRRP